MSVQRPNFAGWYTSSLGLGIASVSTLLIGVLTGVQVDQMNHQLVIISRFVAIGGGVFASMFLAATLTLHWLDHKKFVRLHRYMTAQAEAGASVEIAIERTRARMDLEIKQAGGYLPWLFHRSN